MLSCLGACLRTTMWPYLPFDNVKKTAFLRWALRILRGFCAGWAAIGWPQPGRSAQFAPALAPAQGCPGPAPKPDRRPRCRWGLAQPERPSAFRSPRSNDPLSSACQDMGGSLGAAFPRPWPEYEKKFADILTQ